MSDEQATTTMDQSSTSNSTTPVQRIRILAPTTQIRPDPQSSSSSSSQIPPAAPQSTPMSLPASSSSTANTSTRPALGRNWTTNTTRHGTTPRAATFFLGKDYERWQRYDRDSLGLENKLGWKRGSASAVNPNAFDPDDFSGSSSEGDYDEAIDSEDDIALSDHESVASSSRFRIDTSMGLHQRLRSSRTSVSTTVDSPLTDGAGSIGASSRRSSMRRFSQSQTSSGSRSRRSSTSVRRERRFSSNGPEAAMHRHETVIGIHTPRCDSICSTSPGSSGGRHTPLSGDMSSAFERIGIAPLSQIKNSPLPSRTASGVDVARIVAAPPDLPGSAPIEVEEEVEIDDPDKPRPPPVARTDSKRERSPGRLPRSPRMGKAPRRRASILLEEAAAAAVAEAEAQARTDREEEKRATAEADKEVKLGTKRLRGKLGMRDEIVERQGHDGSRRSSSSIALPLAKRKKPIRLEGTLYDRSGPFREGAVHDGLSVRLFSTEQPDRSTGELTTYLITTPDNRVASAAKLRRWAMDGAGNFFAAMEIKSIEAKLRNADPQAMAAAAAGGAGSGTRELARELRTTYVDDLLDEVQKAETLNPGRTTVANVLRTEDGKYIRLEEDYPEEAFFVIAGCEEEELAAVVTLVFAQALRKIVGIHQAGWMHGDIKLENLMFDATGELLVIDYENANPYRGVAHAKALAKWQASLSRGGESNGEHTNGNGHAPPRSPPLTPDSNIDPDGLVRLVSYDWTPPEAVPSPHGRCMGPTGDMWALGCNLVRAFALRDGIADTAVRDALLGDGQARFLSFRDTLVSVSGEGQTELKVDLDELGRLIEEEEKESAASDRWDEGHPSNGHGSATGLDASTPTTDYFAAVAAPSKPGGAHADMQTPTANGISAGDGTGTGTSTPFTPQPPALSTAPCSPTHLLRRFHAEAPRILSYVLARCITAHVLQRSARSGAEQAGLDLVARLEEDEPERFKAGLEAVRKAIELSGSEWVRPKLEEARESLGLV